MVIFLDIDGVLNKQSDWVNRFYIRKECIEVLGTLAKQINCKEIVLSSTWRACEGEIQPEFYINLKTQLHAEGLFIGGVTPISKRTREEEILYYAKRHNIDKYIALDDDESLFPLGQVPLYVVNYKTGLTVSDIKKIEKYLKKYWR